MILTRYRWSPVTVSGPTLPTVTDRYRILPLLAVKALLIVIKDLLYRYLKFYKNATLVTQVTVRFDNGQ